MERPFVVGSGYRPFIFLGFPRIGWGGGIATSGNVLCRWIYPDVTSTYREAIVVRIKQIRGIVELRSDHAAVTLTICQINRLSPSRFFLVVQS